MAKETRRTKRVNRVTIMLSDSELAKINEAATALMITNSAFMRNAAVLDAWKILQSMNVQKEYLHAARLYSS